MKQKFSVCIFSMTLLRSACLQVLEDFGATSLQAYLRGGRLGLHDVLRVGIAVASALDHVHAGGLLHLDVSCTLLDDSCQTFLGAPKLSCMFTASGTGVDSQEFSALIH